MPDPMTSTTPREATLDEKGFELTQMALALRWFYMHRWLGLNDPKLEPMPGFVAAAMHVATEYWPGGDKEIDVPHASVTPPDGYVMVPREPTPEMYGAGGVAEFKNDMACTPVREAVGNIYRAMISASPIAGEGQ